MSKNFTVNLKIWRQEGPKVPGRFADYVLDSVNEHMSFLEMLDVLNEELMNRDEDPVEFDYDCREGICGSCNLMVNGQAHGPRRLTAVCQLHMREYNHGDTIVIEPWRASSFPIIKDLVVDRSSLDRIIAKGGYISTKSGSAPEANAIPIEKLISDESMDYAACIGCGACVAACPNSSASLFTAAKISQLNILPQGDTERKIRTTTMVDQMEAEGFGDCSNHAECEAVCPKGISITSIAQMRKDYMKAVFA